MVNRKLQLCLQDVSLAFGADPARRRQVGRLQQTPVMQADEPTGNLDSRTGNEIMTMAGPIVGVLMAFIEDRFPAG